MRETEVELPLEPPCLLTGEPAELRPVKLRRMLFLFVVWVVSRDRRWLTLRFRTPAMAYRARTVLRRATGGRP